MKYGKKIDVEKTLSSMTGDTSVSESDVEEVIIVQNCLDFFNLLITICMPCLLLSVICACKIVNFNSCNVICIM